MASRWLTYLYNLILLILCAFSDQSKIGYPEAFPLLKTGRRGRPRKVPNLQFLQDAMSPKRRLSLQEIADLLGIHRHTLRAHLRSAQIDYKFAALSDSDLDILVKTFRALKPESGWRYLIGFLRNHGLKVQKSRVFRSINRVDRLGRVLRERNTIQRRKYKVSRPNALWHMDGHHKLILWGIVIHGFIDGYCRTVSYSYVFKPGMNFYKLLHRSLASERAQTIALRPY